MPRSSASWALLRRFCVPHWGIAAGLAGTLVASAFFSAVPPLVLARTVDALEHSQLHDALLAIVLYAAASICGSICSSGTSYLGTRYREDMARALRLQVTTAVHQARFEELSRLTPGEMTNRLVSDVDSLSNAIQYGTLPILSALLNLTAMVAAMFALNVPMAAIGVVLLVLPAIPPHFISKRIGEISRATAAVKDRLLGAAQDTFTPGALMVLKNAQAHERERERVRVLADAIRANNLRTTLVNAMLSIGANGLALIGPTAILIVGAYLVSRHAISVGVLVAFIAYQMRIYGPFASLSGLQVQFRTVGVILDRLSAVIDLTPEQGGTLPFAPGDIVFEQVTRCGRSGDVLRELNLIVPHGAHVALIGHSGAGKSTIASLLLRFNEPHGGSVRVGSHALAEYDLADLRRSVVLVTQDGHIFDDSLQHNITYGRPACSDAEIDAAISVSGLRTFVATLPDGLRTRVGPRGFNVSGGERQRIAVARALLMRPNVLILDEALTGVDLRMETEILRGVRELMRGRTLLVITHRVHSVSDFDELFILSNGSIAMSGTHDRLLANDPWYRNLLQERSDHAMETLR